MAAGERESLLKKTNAPPLASSDSVSDSAHLLEANVFTRRQFNKVLDLLDLLGLVFMGRHKCEVIACLSCEVKCKLKNCYNTVYFTCGE